MTVFTILLFFLLLRVIASIIPRQWLSPGTALTQILLNRRRNCICIFLFVAPLLLRPRIIPAVFRFLQPFHLPSPPPPPPRQPHYLLLVTPLFLVFSRKLFLPRKIFWIRLGSNPVGLYLISNRYKEVLRRLFAVHRMFACVRNVFLVEKELLFFSSFFFCFLSFCFFFCFFFFGFEFVFGWLILVVRADRCCRDYCLSFGEVDWLGFFIGVFCFTDKYVYTWKISSHVVIIRDEYIID